MKINLWKICYKVKIGGTMVYLKNLFLLLLLGFFFLGCRSDDSSKDVKTVYWDNNKQNIKATRIYIRKGNKQLPDGKWQQWYRNGNLASERIFREGKLVSSVKVWHPNRKLKALIPYNSNNKIHGVAKWWNKKGKLVQSSKYENSTGDMYTFYPNYAISSRMHFVNGKLKKTTYYSQDGKKITIHEYLKILKKVGYDTFP